MKSSTTLDDEQRQSRRRMRRLVPEAFTLKSVACGRGTGVIRNLLGRGPLKDRAPCAY